MGHNTQLFSTKAGCFVQLKKYIRCYIGTIRMAINWESGKEKVAPIDRKPRPKGPLQPKMCSRCFPIWIAKRAGMVDLNAVESSNAIAEILSTIPLLTLHIFH